MNRYDEDLLISEQLIHLLIVSRLVDELNYEFSLL